jgi:hypothetical protein
MAHRLCNFQLSEDNYAKEKRKIIEIGQQNGHQKERIQKIISKHERRTTFTNLNVGMGPKQNNVETLFNLAMIDLFVIDLFFDHEVSILSINITKTDRRRLDAATAECTVALLSKYSRNSRV